MPLTLRFFGATFVALCNIVSVLAGVYVLTRRTRTQLWRAVPRLKSTMWSTPDEYSSEQMITSALFYGNGLRQLIRDISQHSLFCYHKKGFEAFARKQLVDLSEESFCHKPEEPKLCSWSDFSDTHDKKNDPLEGWTTCDYTFDSPEEDSHSLRASSPAPTQDEIKPAQSVALENPHKWKEPLTVPYVNFHYSAYYMDQYRREITYRNLYAYNTKPSNVQERNLNWYRWPSNFFQKNKTTKTSHGRQGTSSISSTRMTAAKSAVKAADPIPKATLRRMSSDPNFLTKKKETDSAEGSTVHNQKRTSSAKSSEESQANRRTRTITSLTRRQDSTSKESSSPRKFADACKVPILKLSKDNKVIARYEPKKIPRQKTPGTPSELNMSLSSSGEESTDIKESSESSLSLRGLVSRDSSGTSAILTKPSIARENTESSVCGSSSHETRLDSTKARKKKRKSRGRKKVQTSLSSESSRTDCLRPLTHKNVRTKVICQIDEDSLNQTVTPYKRGTLSNLRERHRSQTNLGGTNFQTDKARNYESWESKDIKVLHGQLHQDNLKTKPNHCRTNLTRWEDANGDDSAKFDTDCDSDCCHQSSKVNNNKPFHSASDERQSDKAARKEHKAAQRITRVSRERNIQTQESTTMDLCKLPPLANNKVGNTSPINGRNSLNEKCSLKHTRRNCSSEPSLSSYLERLSETPASQIKSFDSCYRSRTEPQFSSAVTTGELDVSLLKLNISLELPNATEKECASTTMVDRNHEESNKSTRTSVNIQVKPEQIAERSSAQLYYQIPNPNKDSSTHSKRTHVHMPIHQVSSVNDNEAKVMTLREAIVNTSKQLGLNSKPEALRESNISRYFREMPNPVRLWNDLPVFDESNISPRVDQTTDKPDVYHHQNDNSSMFTDTKDQPLDKPLFEVKIENECYPSDAFQPLTWSPNDSMQDRQCAKYKEAMYQKTKLPKDETLRPINNNLSSHFDTHRSRKGRRDLISSPKQTKHHQIQEDVDLEHQQTKRNLLSRRRIGSFGEFRLPSPLNSPPQFTSHVHLHVDDSGLDKQRLKFVAVRFPQVMSTPNLGVETKKTDTQKRRSKSKTRK